MTTRKKHKKKKKYKKGRGTGESFRNNKVTISLLSQKDLPVDITKRVQRHHAATSLQKYTRKYVHTKRQLRRRFENYDDLGGDYDPREDEIVLLTNIASRILKPQDYRNRFWRTVIGNIYIGLHEYRIFREVGSINYIQTEAAFMDILKNVMNYQETRDYLYDDYLYTELVEYVLGHND